MSETRLSWEASVPGVKLIARPSDKPTRYTLELQVRLPAGSDHVKSERSKTANNGTQDSLFGFVDKCSFTVQVEKEHLVEALANAAALIEGREEMSAFSLARYFELRSLPDQPKDW